MSERRGPFSHLQPKTAEFLVAHYHDGAYDRFSEAAQIETEAKGSKFLAPRLNAMSLYFNLPDTGLKEVGEKLSKPVTRERARQLIKEGITLLSDFATSDVREQFPLEGLPLGKPRTLRSRVLRSESAGGIQLQVAALANQGKSAQEIKRFLDDKGITPADVRPTLTGWGIDLPFPTGAKLAEERAKLVQNLSDPAIPLEQFEKSWNNLAHGQRAPLQSQGIIVSLARIARLAGLHGKGGDFEAVKKCLAERGMHVKTFVRTIKTGVNKGLVQRFDIIAKRETEQSVEIIKAEPALDFLRQHRVQKIAGPQSSHHPTTYEIRDNRNYAAIETILESEGVSIGFRAGVTIASVLARPDCPVGIYRDKTSHRIYRPDIPILRSFIRQIKSEL